MLLLFNPPPPQLSDSEGDSDWTSLRSPPSQLRRLDSYDGSNCSATTSSTTSGGGAEVGRRQQGEIDSSLLPSHDGNGVFIRRGGRGGVESLRGTDTSGSKRI